MIGGGIAGLSAALTLADRGVRVRLLEREATWGGRARSWDVGEGRSMSRGFHAFFRQYYTLRQMLRRSDPDLHGLADIGDYPLQRGDGLRDGFRGIPRTPPWSAAAFALRSPSMPMRQLMRVNLQAALELVRVRFPEAFSAYDGQDAAGFLDRLRFPAGARHLALEVFARSFFADPREFSAGELVAMFHTYFLGSAEGLVFDVPVDAYSTVLWSPLVERLRAMGADTRTAATVHSVRFRGDMVHLDTDSGPISTESLVIAADPRSARQLLAGAEWSSAGWAGGAWRRWRERLGGQGNAPPFAVWRLWLDRKVRASAPAFLGTAGFGPLDNVSVLDRFEQTASRWADAHGGSVVELHAYALNGYEPADETVLRRELRSQLDRLYPDLRGAEPVHQEWLVKDDCPLIGTLPWAARPTVATPHPAVVLAGDWLRTDEPVALMERAALTGVHAANRLLARWGVSGQDWWSPPMTGVLRGRR